MVYSGADWCDVNHQFVNGDGCAVVDIPIVSLFEACVESRQFDLAEVCGQRGGDPWALEYGIGNTHQANQLQFYFAFSDGSAAGWIPFFEAEENVWYHTAVSYDGTWVRAYVDGEEIYSNDEWAGKEINQNISRIGGGALGDDFEGDIDEAILFNVAITEDDVKSLMSGEISFVDASGKITSTWGEIKNTALR